MIFLSQTLFFFVFFRFLYDKLFIISSSALILLSSFSVYSFYIPFSSVVFQFFFGKLFVIFSTQFPFSIIFSSCFSVYSFCIAVSSFLPRFFFNKLHFFLVTFFSLVFFNHCNIFSITMLRRNILLFPSNNDFL